MKLNSTDIIFYLSVLGMVWMKVGEQVHVLVPSVAYSWFSVLFGAIAVIAFALYEKINGNPPTPPGI